MKTAIQEATLIPRVETPMDRLTVLHGTVLRCIGALGGNADSTSHLVCEALQQVADELAEIMAQDDQLRAFKLSRQQHRDVTDPPVDSKQ